jgi:hypothetical protein
MATKGSTKNEHLGKLKLCHENLTNDLLVKLIKNEDISEGMKQLDEMVDIIDFLENQIGREEVKTFTMVGDGKSMTICPLDGEAEKHKTSVLALEQGEEKHVTESLMNGNSMTTCPLDGGAVKDKSSVQALEQGEEKHKSESLLNCNSMTTTCPLEGGAVKDMSSVQALEQGEEKHESKSPMNGNSMTICPLDGGEVKDKTSVEVLDQVVD